MTYRVLDFLSNFARNAKYSIILSGHLPFLTLTSGIDLLNDDQTLSFMTLGRYRATVLRSQKVPVCQNFCLLSEFHCRNDRLKLYYHPWAKGSFSGLLMDISKAWLSLLVTNESSCTVLILSPAYYCSHTVSVQVRQNLNCALYFIFLYPGKLVALRGPCPLLQAV